MNLLENQNIESQKKVCRRRLERNTGSCRDCLFEVLCHYEDMKAKNE